MADDDFLNAMYQDDEDAPVAASKPSPDGSVANRGIMSMPAMTQALRRLERELADSKKTIARLENNVRMLLGRGRRADLGSRNQSQRIDDLWAEVENKVDMRRD